MLSDSQIERYSRQIVLAEIGGRGQERLLGSEVEIHGGGDGALACARYLAGAGVGLLGLADAAARTELERGVTLVLGLAPPHLPLVGA